MNLCKRIECQYLVGDSAFENDWFFVAAFKKLPNCTPVRDQERFNNKLSKLRIILEHGIGMLKGRFPWLRSIRFVITEDIKSLKRILHVIDATIILHNMLVHLGKKNQMIGSILMIFQIWMKLHVPHMTKTMSSMKQFLNGDQSALRRNQNLQYFNEFFF
jgi:hypothetical protein